MASEDYSVLKSAVENALNELYKKDHYLIINHPRGNASDYHVSERGIVFRFGIYLQKILDGSLFKDYNIDVEYNRNMYEKKRLPSFTNGTFPDLILHMRGSNEHNILILEFKTWWNNNTADDSEKIKEFMDKNGVYRYKMGACIVLEKDNPTISWIVH